MTLVIPPEVKKAINPYSGYLSKKSPYGKKNLKGLFMLPENHEYLAKELYSLLTHPGYIRHQLESEINSYLSEETIPINSCGELPECNADVLAKLFKETKDKIVKAMPEMINAHPLPHFEDITVANPVQQLHHVNLDFLMKTSRNMITSPDTLINDYYRINPETGKKEFIEYDFDASSYSNGYWDPSKLFMNSKRNEESGQWNFFETLFYSNPEVPTPYHIYNRKVYDFKKSHQFAPWNYSVNYRPYEKDMFYNDETLKDGSADRRVQRPSGYDLSSLINKSTY